jgi:hypothetical protein
MANRLVEGFDWLPSNFDSLSDLEKQRLLGANGMFAYGYQQVHPAVFRRTGRFGFGAALYFNATNGSAFDPRTGGWFIALDDTTPIDEGFIGIACFIPSTANLENSPPAVGVADGVNDELQLTVSFEPNGVLRIWRGHRPADIAPPYTIITAPNLLASSKMNSFQEDQWFFLEFHPIIANSGGSCEVRVNTVPVLSLTGADTAGGTVTTAFDSIYLGGVTRPVTPQQAYFDDLYCNDTVGATCNSWGGNLRVKSQLMIADGAIQDFSIGGTSPAATHWQSVLNTLLDDSKYVFSPDVGDQELFTPDPNLNAPLVRVVQVRMALRQDDSTQRSAKALLRIGGVVYEDDVEHFTNQTFTFYRGKWELSPATGVSFTGAEVNGLQPGVKVQS